MTRTLALICALFVLAPASALADGQDGPYVPPPAGQPDIFTNINPSPGYQKMTIDDECDAPANPGETTCTFRLRLIINGQIAYDDVRTLPVNESGESFDVDVSKIRDADIKKSIAKRKTLPMKATLKALNADGSVEINHISRSDSPFGGWNRRTAWKCIAGPAVKASGGAVIANPGSSKDSAITANGFVPSYVNFQTGDTATTVSYNGMHYTVRPHSTARMDCVEFFSSAGPFLVPALFLLDGSALVFGRPTRQFSAAVLTPEATFRSLNKESVNFEITQDPKKHVATMSVKHGRTLQATHIIGGGADFPCTSGKTVKVGRRGLIK